MTELFDLKSLFNDEKIFVNPAYTKDNPDASIFIAKKECDKICGTTLDIDAVVTEAQLLGKAIRENNGNSPTRETYLKIKKILMQF